MTFVPREFKTIGSDLHAMATRLFPICRSITGHGVRETLNVLKEIVPVDVREVPTGTEVFDWTVPREWNIRDAYVATGFGNRVIDFKACNLHVVNGSSPVRCTMAWSELRSHIHTLPDQPDLVPYRTCHFKDDWGFCVSQNHFDILDGRDDAEYEVVIDSTLTDGSLTYGEYFLPGRKLEEVLISAHICHPSLANDNLSGICIAAQLARRLSELPRREYSYRFVFAPATIGAITWLALNQGKLDAISHGLVLCLLGDPGKLTYKRSRAGDSAIDRVVQQVLSASGDDHEIRDFVPFGYDERQYCSPGINLPMGCLMRTPDGEFPEYHTSADNLELITADALSDSFQKCLDVIEILEMDETFINLKPECEPRLGRYGLYESLPPSGERESFQRAVQWVLNLSDGDHGLFDIAERSGLAFSGIRRAAEALVNCGLIAPQGTPAPVAVKQARTA